VTVVIPPVAITIAVPSMVVFETAAIALPVARKKALSVMMRRNPDRSRVRWASPVSGMPLIMVAHGIPVALDPNKLRTWAYWLNPNDALGRRRTNSDPDGYLGGHRARNKQRQCQ